MSTHTVSPAIIAELEAEEAIYRELATCEEEGETEEEATDRADLFHADGDDIANLRALYLSEDTERTADYYHKLDTNTREFLTERCPLFNAWMESVPLPEWLA